jgi:hypothetical protein
MWIFELELNLEADRERRELLLLVFFLSRVFEEPLTHLDMFGWMRFDDLFADKPRVEPRFAEFLYSPRRECDLDFDFDLVIEWLRSFIGVTVLLLVRREFECRGPDQP